MKEFSYTITDEYGLHARPAGLLVKEVKQFQSDCTIIRGGVSANMKGLMRVMALGVKKGDTVTVQANGPDEDAAIAALKAFFEENL